MARFCILSTLSMSFLKNGYHIVFPYSMCGLHEIVVLRTLLCCFTNGQIGKKCQFADRQIICRFMIDMKIPKTNNIYMKRSALATMNENYQEMIYHFWDIFEKSSVRHILDCAGIILQVKSFKFDSVFSTGLQPAPGRRSATNPP